MERGNTRQYTFPVGGWKRLRPRGMFDSPPLSLPCYRDFGGVSQEFNKPDRDESISDRMSREPLHRDPIEIASTAAALFLDRRHCFLCRSLVDINHCLSAIDN